MKIVDNKGIATTLVLAIVFGISTLGLSSYVVYDKMQQNNQNVSSNTNNADESSETNNATESETTSEGKNTVQSVSGVYKTTLKDFKCTEEQVEDMNVTITFDDNGLFFYRTGCIAEYGVMGNYYVEGNTVNLTYWYNTASDASLRPTNGTKQMVINSDGSITDNSIKNSDFSRNNITSINLKKDPSEKPEKFNLGERLFIAFPQDEINSKVFEPNL